MFAEMTKRMRMRMQNSQRCFTTTELAEADLMQVPPPFDILDRSRSFQIVSNCFRLFQIVSDRFRLFQIVSDRIRLFQIVSDCFRLFQIVSDCFRLFQIDSDWVRLFEMTGEKEIKSCIQYVYDAEFIHRHLKFSFWLI